HILNDGQSAVVQLDSRYLVCTLVTNIRALM
nr:hypothetical protein [Tanacetum cinerariifolium]